MNVKGHGFVSVKGAGNSKSQTLNSKQFFNSFEPVILKKYPAIAKAKQTLESAGCTGVMMSGSGSTVYGFVVNRFVKLMKRKIAVVFRGQAIDIFFCSTI